VVGSGSESWEGDGITGFLPLKEGEGNWRGEEREGMGKRKQGAREDLTPRF